MPSDSLAPQPEQVAAFFRRHRTGLVTLIFTDLVDSTALMQQLGDQAGATFLQQRRQLVRQTLREFPEGQEIETAGDSFLLIFAKPSDAVRFAVLLQARFRAFRQEAAIGLQERIGIHLGEVVIEEHETEAKAKDLYGIQIATCARVMGLAQEGQVLLTRGVFDSARQVLKGEELPGVEALSWVSHGPYSLKGIAEPVEVCEVGEPGHSPLAAPKTSEKAQRVARPEEEPVLGWRPAVGQAVPNTQWVLEKSLGEGGFGEVWLGRHAVMKERRVFKFCFRADRARSLKREMTLFRLIKERIGDHPNIVSMREVYFEQPPYYVEMDYAEGQDLASWCERHGGADKVPLETKLEIIAQAAEALQAAHDAGVIHRDVKPGNILVSGQWFVASEPPATSHQPLMVKLTDFGIGQVVSQECLAGVTKAGFTMTMLGSESSSRSGTQLYMAPELLEGKPATTRSDIYSLGVALYQLLVADFKQAVTIDWATRIPDELLREDLEHCFAGNPEDRFAGAAQLARHLRSWELRRAERARQEAEKAERESLRRQAERRRRMLVAGALVGLVLAALAVALGYGLRQAQQAHERQRRFLYASDMKAAQVALAQNNRGLAADLLQRQVPKRGEEDLRGVEWLYLWSEVRGKEAYSFPHEDMVADVAFSPDDRLLATVDFSQRVQVWDIASEKRIRQFQGTDGLNKRCLGFTPDGKRFLFLGTKGVEVRETSGWGLVTNLPCRWNSPFVLSANGRRLVLGAATEMQAWDLLTWHCQRLPHAAASIYNLAVSADGMLVAFSRAWFATRDSIFLWDLRNHATTLLEPKTDVLSLALSADGRWLAAGHFSGQVELWDLTRRRRALSWRAHKGLVCGLAFSPDSQRLASGGDDQVIAIWQTGATNRLDTLRGHQGPIWGLAFSRDGARLASGGGDCAAKIWEIQARQSHDQTRWPGLPATAVPICPSADGTGLLTLDDTETVATLWDLRSGQLRWSFAQTNLQQAGCPRAYYFLKPELALGFSTNHVLHIFDMPSRKQVRSVSLPVATLEPARLSPDRRWLLAQSGPMRLFDLDAGRAYPGFGYANPVGAAANFSDDSRLLAYAPRDVKNNDHDIHIWNLQAGKEQAICHGHRWVITAIRFSRDGRLLASGDWTGDVWLWSVKTGKPLWPALKGHQWAVAACAFSADGKTLVTGATDFTLRFWSVAAGQEMLLFEDAVPTAPRTATSWEWFYSAQAEVNPVPDLLVWQELAHGTRVVSLPTLSGIDATLARERRRVLEIGREAKARQRQEAASHAAINRDPGAIKQWLILGPIPLAPSQTEIEGLDRDLVPNESALRPRAGERARPSGGKLIWRAVHLPDYVLDFNALFGRVCEHSAVYAVCYVRSPAARSDLGLLVGSDDQSKIYLNGKQVYVYREPEGRGAIPDEDTVQGIDLKAGLNVLVFKVVNVALGWGGSVRFTDSAGNPVTGLEILISPD